MNSICPICSEATNESKVCNACKVSKPEIENWKVTFLDILFAKQKRRRFPMYSKHLRMRTNPGKPFKVSWMPTQKVPRKYYTRE